MNEQEKREKDGNENIIMIRRREANSEEKGKSDELVTVKILLEGGMIEKISFGMSEEA